MSSAPNAMTTDPSTDKWQQNFGLVLAIVGGIVAGVVKSLRWFTREARHERWIKRKKELRRMLDEIKDEDTLKSIVRHERTHWQHRQKDESDG